MPRGRSSAPSPESEAFPNQGKGGRALWDAAGAEGKVSSQGPTALLVNACNARSRRGARIRPIRAQRSSKSQDHGHAGRPCLLITGAGAGRCRGCYARSRTGGRHQGRTAPPRAPTTRVRNQSSMASACLGLHNFRLKIMHMFWAFWLRFWRFALLAGPSNDSVMRWPVGLLRPRFFAAGVTGVVRPAPRSWRARPRRRGPWPDDRQRAESIGVWG